MKMNKKALKVSGLVLTGALVFGSEYYQMKLDGLENTQAYKDLEAQIAAIKQSVYDRYTKEIDQVFAAQTTTTN